jgi:hypothetical protein
MEARRSSATSAYNTPTRRHIPEDVLLHNHRPENPKSYNTYAAEYRAAESLVQCNREIRWLDCLLAYSYVTVSVGYRHITAISATDRRGQ